MQVMEGIEENFGQDVLFHQMKVVSMLLFLIVGDYVVVRYVLNRMKKEVSIRSNLVGVDQRVGFAVTRHGVEEYQ